MYGELIIYKLLEISGEDNVISNYQKFEKMKCINDDYDNIYDDLTDTCKNVLIHTVSNLIKDKNLLVLYQYLYEDLPEIKAE